MCYNDGVMAPVCTAATALLSYNTEEASSTQLLRVPEHILAKQI
jgi:hypothetical protein